MTPFEKADEAKRLLQNPVLNEALDTIKTNLVLIALAYVNALASE